MLVRSPGRRTKIPRRPGYLLKRALGGLRICKRSGVVLRFEIGIFSNYAMNFAELCVKPFEIIYE